MKPAGLHHVSINVTDVAEARRFYVETLGLTERDDRPEFRFAGAWLQAGDQQVHLIEGDPPAYKGQHFALAVDDLAAAVEELRAEGVEVSDPKAVGGGIQSFLTDPSGNGVELNQPPR